MVIALPVLYGSPLSPFVRKVSVVLEEKNLPYTVKPVRPHDRNLEFSAISPLGKIPAYKDEKTTLADSSVICLYLEKAYPDITLYPQDAISFAKALWFEEYFDSGMIVPMNTIYFQKYFNPRFLNIPTNETLLKEAQEALPPMLSYLESQLKAGEWMVNNQFSIADISLAVGFADLGFAQFDVDANCYPKLSAYLKRIHARPSFVKSAALIQAFVQKMEQKRAAHKNLDKHL